MSRPTLVYAVDPLCGWCFAFVDTVAALRRTFSDDVSWEIACGGLVVGPRVSPIAQAAGYLRAGMRAVEARTPARFGAAFEAVLEDGRWISNSEPACRASLVVQQRFGGAAAVDFSGALATGFYGQGRVPDAIASIHAAATEAGIEPGAVLDLWDTDEAKALTERAFGEARSRGLSSYPSLYLRAPEDPPRGHGDLRPVLAGWASPTDAIAAVRAAIRATV